MASRATICITGIAGNLGRFLAQKLHRRYHVIGIDPRPCNALPKDVKHYQVDFRRRKTEDIFRRYTIKAFIHLGIIHRMYESSGEQHSFNVAGMQHLLDLCLEHNVEKVVMLSSADAYGAMPGVSNYIDEDTTLQGDMNYPGMRIVVTLDRMVQSFLWKYRHINTVLLRPVHIVGPYLKNATSSYLRLPICPYIIGFDPMLQVVHQEDVMRALALVIRKKRASGIYNLAGTKPAPLRRVLKKLKKPLIPIPAPMAKLAISKLWDYNVSAFPPSELEHLQYDFIVDATKFVQDFSFKATYTWDAILDEYIKTIAKVS